MKCLQKNLCLIAFVLLTSLSYAQGIATRGMPWEQLTFRPQMETGGMIVGSVTFTNPKAKFNNYFFLVSAVTTDKKTWRKNSQEFFVKPEQIFKMKHQGETDGGLTYIFAMKRNEGQYEINHLRLASVGYGTSRSDIVKGFKIPINVKKGEITYVGNIHVNEYAAPGETIVTLNDTYERDINMAKILQPYVIWTAAVHDPEREIIYEEK